MKKHIISLIALLMAAALVFSGCAAGITEGAVETPDNSAEPVAAATSYEHLFTEQDVMEIYIEIDEADWQDILDNAIAEEYHEVAVTVNGVTAANVGFRTKGNSSLSSVASSDSDRYSFRVKVDKYVDGQTLDGLDEFVLNSNFSDPSYLREYYTYLAMAELGGITPYVGFCNLYINGELFGFYLCIEAMDDSFAERYSEAADTALYKADGERCTLLSDMDLSQFKSQVGDDDSFSNLQTLVDLLNQDTVTKEEIEGLIDVPSVLRAIAINTVMGNYDSYSSSMAHNYYLLYSDGIFYYVGWDYNMSIGGFMDGGGSSVIADIDTPVYGTTLESRPLFDKILAIDEYKEQYYGYLEQLVEFFSDFENDVAELVNVIGEYVKNDPTAFYSYDEFLANTSLSGEDLVTQAQESLANSGDSSNMELPEGMEMPTDGQMPDMGNFPADGEMPEGFDPENNLGQFGGGQRPDMGEMPEGFDDGDMQDQFGNMGGGGGMMMNSAQVSIVDYIMARVSVVKGLLNGTYTGETSTGGTRGMGGFGGGA